jgi:hypothetical protein
VQLIFFKALQSELTSMSIKVIEANPFCKNTLSRFQWDSRLPKDMWQLLGLFARRKRAATKGVARHEVSATIKTPHALKGGSRYKNPKPSLIPFPTDVGPHCPVLVQLSSTSLFPPTAKFYRFIGVQKKIGAM